MFNSQRLIIYNRDHDYLPATSRLPFYFFGTSSKGNSTYVKPLRVLIDLGLSKHWYTDVDPNFFSKVSYLLLTHQHGDHLKLTTLKYILKLCPHLKIVCDSMVAAFIKQHITLTTTQSQQFIVFAAGSAPTLTLPLLNGTNMTVQPYPTQHGDLTNVAYVITYRQHRLLYATDLQTTALLPQFHQQLTYCLLESNYDERIVRPVLADPRNPGYYEAVGNLRHLSEQCAWTYVTANLAPDGIFIPLHASKRHSSLRQYVNDKELMN